MSFSMHVGMVHKGQRLALGLEASDHLLAIHAGLNDLERDDTADRILLLGAIDHSHSTACNLRENFIGADLAAGFDRCRFDLVHGKFPCRELYRPPIEKIIVGSIVLQQRFQFVTQPFVTAGRLLDEGRALVEWPFERRLVQALEFEPVCRIAHGCCARVSSRRSQLLAKRQSR